MVGPGFRLQSNILIVVHCGHLLDGPQRALSVRPFQKVQREVINFSCVVRKNERSRCILSKNCRIHGEICEISGPYKFWAPTESNVSDVWNWNCWTFFGSKIEVGGPCHPHPPEAMSLHISVKWEYHRKVLFTFPNRIYFYKYENALKFKFWKF